MSKCSYPVSMYRTQDGSLLHDNHKGLGISELKRPCGYCIKCRLNHSETWAIRMTHHAQSYDETSFLTLTYNDVSLPENSSLQYRDVTLFIKKLRKILSKTPYKDKINYYRVGEYGDQLSRPHYHLILFGFDFTYKLRYKGEENLRTHESSKEDRKYYKSNFLTDLWGHGHADIGDVDYSTCQYVAKYVMKKVYGPKSINHYGQKQPEKASMSKGIGKSWLQKFWSDVYPDDYCLQDKKKYRTPKYYDTWLEKNKPDLYASVKQSREDSIHEDAPLENRVLSHKVQLLKNASFLRDGVIPHSYLDDQLYLRNKKEVEYFHNLKKQESKNV